MKSVKDRVCAIIAKVLAVDEADILLGSHLEIELNADSIDAIEIAMELEKEFNIIIPDEDLFKRWTLVGDIVDYIQRRITE